MDLKNLPTILKGEPGYRADQVNKAIYADFSTSFDEIKNLPKSLREILAQECSLEINAVVHKSDDGQTEKALITYSDGIKIETVLMRHDDGRNTVCVSSQAGCPMKCSFCATGQLGFRRNLSTEEILEQVIFYCRELKKENQKVTNVVFMGMGEPFLNYENVVAAIRILNEKIGIGIRKISISTCGIIEGIKKLTEENMQVNLAISLHAPIDELREKLMPVNKNYPIKNLLETIKKYFTVTHRKVMFEYVMLKGVNDSADNAKQLVSLLQKYLERGSFMINLISFNETKTTGPTGEYKSAPQDSIKKFKDILVKSGFEVTQRFKFGREVKGACGQLAAES